MTTSTPKLSPACEGTIAAALDDAKRQGLGDDDTVTEVMHALFSECHFHAFDAHYHAYRAVHGAA